MFENLQQAFQGKKTIILAVAAGIVLGLRVADVIDAKTAEHLFAALGLTGVITLKMAMNRIERGL